MPRHRHRQYFLSTMAEKMVAWKQSKSQLDEV
jgi:hypothetical protein